MEIRVLKKYFWKSVLNPTSIVVICVKTIPAFWFFGKNCDNLQENILYFGLFVIILLNKRRDCKKLTKNMIMLNTHHLHHHHRILNAGC